MLSQSEKSLDPRKKMEHVLLGVWWSRPRENVLVGGENQARFTKVK